jgi:hypothetical protein
LARGAERPKSLEDIRIVRGGTVYRVDLSGMVSGKLNSDMPLQPGDVVYVPETRW